MKLLVHAGLNKAGSTYLQNLLITNSDALRAAGTLYPNDAGADGRSINGGNAAAMARALAAGDYAQVDTELRHWSDMAKQAQCDTVAVSAEGLMASVADADTATTLRGLSEAAGFREMLVLVIVRDPVQHAISAYCHRIGLVTRSDFPVWLAEEYETPGILRRFLDSYTATPPVPYRLEVLGARPLLDIISDFVGTGLTLPTFAIQSNPTMTVTEARATFTVAQTLPEQARYVNRGLRSLPRSSKADDTALREQWERLVYAWLAAHTETLNALQGLLPDPLMTPQDLARYRREPSAQTVPMMLSDTQLPTLVRAVGRQPTLRERAAGAKGKLRARLRSRPTSVRS